MLESVVLISEGVKKKRKQKNRSQTEPKQNLSNPYKVNPSPLYNYIRYQIKKLLRAIIKIKN